jgi:SAM-dependent methyltransferase
MRYIGPAMDSDQIELLAALEDRHWWYKERRAIVRRELRRIGRPGLALDIGAAAGGNTGILRKHGWRALALDYSPTAVAIGRSRGIEAMRADGRRLPLRSGALDLVTAMDVLEHIEEDHLAAAEIRRVLKPGGTTLISVPCDMALWSTHDVAVGHVRRYDRASLINVLEKAGLAIDSVWSWNVLLRPAIQLRRGRRPAAPTAPLAAESSSLPAESDLADVPPLINTALTSVIVAERYLPVKSLPGVTLFVRARRPS